MRRFAALPWGTKLGILRVGAWLWEQAVRLTGDVRAGQAWAGVPPAVTDCPWSVRGRVLDWCWSPVSGTPRCCCVRVCQSPVLILGSGRRPVFSLLFRSEPLQEAGGL
jgi:hypothetical protein